jgi:hypothetical protein
MSFSSELFTYFQSMYNRTDEKKKINVGYNFNSGFGEG